MIHKHPCCSIFFRASPFIRSASHLVGLLLRTPRNLNKRGKGVITSANLALVPACGDASQHISVVWLQMNECLQKMKVHNSESRLTTGLFIDVLFVPWFRSEMTSIHSVIAVLSEVFGWTCLAQSQHYHPNQSISLWSVLLIFFIRSHTTEICWASFFHWINSEHDYVQQDFLNS